MIPFRTQIKFFLENPETIDVGAFSGLFQRWIQVKALEGLLIDVADYRHVHQGPSVVLIGHEADYTIEQRDGRLGLVITRKHQHDPDLQSSLQTALRSLLAAAQLLEAEPSFQPALKFRADEIEIRLLDRLRYPNTPETFEAVKSDLQAVLTARYGTDQVSLSPVHADPRYLFTVLAKAESVASIAPFKV